MKSKNPIVLKPSVVMRRTKKGTLAQNIRGAESDIQLQIEKMGYEAGWKKFYFDPCIFVLSSVY